MKIIDPIEILIGIRLLSVKDIGLFKLMSASSRPAKKDHQLKEKYKRFNRPKDRNIFDLDKENSVLDNPLLLLTYDSNFKVSKDKMMHSHDNILNIEGTASWPLASMNWRMRLRKLCRHLDIQFPSARTR